MTALTPKQQSEIYLKSLFGKCKRGHLVLCNQGGASPSAFKHPINVDEISTIIRVQKDLFIKVNPIDYDQVLARNRGGIGDESEVVTIVGLQFDIDCDKENYPTRAEVHAAIEQMPLDPSMIVSSDGRSKGGYHAYWLFDEPVEIDSESKRKEMKAFRNAGMRS